MKLAIEDFDVDNAPGAYTEVHVNLYGPVRADGSRVITTCRALVERVLDDDTIVVRRDPSLAVRRVVRLDAGRPKPDEV